MTYILLMWWAAGLAVSEHHGYVECMRAMLHARELQPYERAVCMPAGEGVST